MTDLQELADELFITEERKQELDLSRKRLTVNHSLSLHRDKVSAADVQAMIDALRAAGMPDTATLRVDGTEGHTRMWAQWTTEPVS